METPILYKKFDLTINNELVKVERKIVYDSNISTIIDKYWCNGVEISEQEYDSLEYEYLENNE